MARPTEVAASLERGEFHERAKFWKNQGKSRRKNLIRNHIEQQYPELVGLKIRRGGHVYDAIEYLLDDLDSYDG